MSPMSMCLTRSCPSWGKCYRAQATPNPQWQAYHVFTVPKRRKKCDSFMPMEKPRNG